MAGKKDKIMGDSYKNFKPLFDQNLKTPGALPGYTNEDNSADPATKKPDPRLLKADHVMPDLHLPPPLPKDEENAYLHLITYELQRIANVNEFMALLEIEQRQQSEIRWEKRQAVDKLVGIRLEELGDKIKEARV